MNLVWYYSVTMQIHILTIYPRNWYIFIAERISAIKALNEGSTMYVRTYMLVTLRNVNFEVTIGLSICAHARAGYQIHALHNDVKPYGTFLGNRGQGGQRGWPYTAYIFTEQGA